MKKKKIIPCVSCREGLFVFFYFPLFLLFFVSLGKRKCDGNIPCSRCKSLKKLHLCRRVETNKRKREEEKPHAPVPLSTNTTKTMIASSPPYYDGEIVGSELVFDNGSKVFPYENSQLDPSVSRLLSMMLSHGSNMLRDRPRDIQSSFGLGFPNFIALEVPAVRGSLTTVPEVMNNVRSILWFLYVVFAYEFAVSIICGCFVSEQ